MSTVFFRDHQREMSGTDASVARISLTTFRAAFRKADSRANVWAEASHAVMHLGTDEETTFVGKWRKGNTSLVVLRASTNDRVDGKHQEYVEGDRRLYMLFSREMRLLKSVPVLQAFYGMGIDDAAAVCSGDYANLSTELRPLFCDSADTLGTCAALGVLCQGYLALHIEGVSDRGGFSLAVGDNAKQDVARALARAGFTTELWAFIKDRIGPVAVISRGQVHQADWWTRPFGGAWPSDDINRELGGRKCPAVRSLFSGEHTVEPLQVAKAYLELAEILKEGD
jgi:hypothetical protein